MKINLVIILLFSSQNLFSQELEVLRLGDNTLPKSKWSEEFTLLEESIDTSSLVFIGTFKVKASVRKFHILNHARVIIQKAKKLGANAYFIESHQRDTINGFFTTVLSTYYASEELKEENDKLTQHKFLYVFGDNNVLYKNKSVSFALNGRIIEINNSKDYFRYDIKEKEIVKLSKGGVLKTSMEIEGDRNRLPLYLRVTNSSAGFQPVTGMVTYSNGDFQIVDGNEARFIIKVLRLIEWR